MVTPEPERPDDHDSDRAPTGGAGPVVRNAAFGVAGGVLQAGVVHGDVYLHAAAPAPVVPRQLPALPSVFAGRAAELAGLDRALAAAAPGHGRPVPAAGGAVALSAISGAGGVGKTWLALVWAHRHLHRFPDGQLFVDLRGFSPSGRPARPVDVLGGFLDALGVARDRRPAGPVARAALYRSLVANRRVLVVLDNAATADQVIPLLPGGGGCAVLVTSRNSLHGLVARHGAHTLRLDVLPQTEAHALLTAALGPARTDTDERATAELVELCGGWPLALGLVTARAADPRLPPADAVADLRAFGLRALDSDDPAASLPAVLSWSLRRLTGRQRRVFALLGAAPGPDIGLPAAARLVGLPEEACHSVLRALVEASLVDRAPGGRHRMHDLVRAYAAGLASDLDDRVRAEASRRLLDFYTATAATAAHLLDPHATPIPLDPGARARAAHAPLTAEAAVSWFDTEHPCLPAAQHHAATAGWHRTAWHLAWATHLYQSQRGHLHDRLAVLRTGLDAARHLGPADEARALRYLGYACADLERHEEATAHLEQSLTTAENAGDPVNRAHTLRALALVLAQRGDDRRALEHATRASDLHREFDNPVQTARTHSTAAWIAARLGLHDTARDHCETALVLQRRHHDDAGEADTLVNLGGVDHLSGRHHRAVDHYQRALTRLRAYGGTYAVAYALDGLGHPLVALGRHDQARAAWREALELYRQQGRDTDARRLRQQLRDLDDPAGTDLTGTATADTRSTGTTTSDTDTTGA
ncbi:ATP-binding protein [Saccharothrix xinjiangensis]|uniref:ATP-binding protein n=1 Tax=Saccharothrix xinjiangensis TaxID=204798 RepID=A0ABV9Y110_9PSEU